MCALRGSLKLQGGLQAWTCCFLGLLRRSSVGPGNFSYQDASASVSYSIYSEIAAPTVFFLVLRALACCASVHSVWGGVDTINSIFSPRFHRWFSKRVLTPTALGCFICGTYMFSFHTKFDRALLSRVQLFVRHARRARVNADFLVSSLIPLSRSICSSSRGTCYCLPQASRTS